MILFYIRGASPDSKQELMLKTPLITVVRRQSKTPKEETRRDDELRSSADLIIDKVSDSDLGREIKKSFARNKNRKLREVIETLESEVRRAK